MKKIKQIYTIWIKSFFPDPIEEYVDSSESEELDYSDFSLNRERYYKAIIEIAFPKFQAFFKEANLRLKLISLSCEQNSKGDWFKLEIALMSKFTKKAFFNATKEVAPQP